MIPRWSRMHPVACAHDRHDRTAASSANKLNKRKWKNYEKKPGGAISGSAPAALL